PRRRPVRGAAGWSTRGRAANRGAAAGPPARSVVVGRWHRTGRAACCPVDQAAERFLAVVVEQTRDHAAGALELQPGDPSEEALALRVLRPGGALEQVARSVQAVRDPARQPLVVAAVRDVMGRRDAVLEVTIVAAAVRRARRRRRVEERALVAARAAVPV